MGEEELEAYWTMGGGIIVSLVSEDAPVCKIGWADTQYLDGIIAVLKKLADGRPTAERTRGPANVPVSRSTPPETPA